jgi:hypothetical protein
MGKFSLKNLFGASVDKVLEQVGKIVDDVVTTKEEKAEKVIELFDKEIEDRKLSLGDIANARDMQKAALAQGDKKSKVFIYNFSWFWSISAMAYFTATTFIPVVNSRVADTVLGFMLGTAVASIITFFYGSSQGSSDKQDLLSKLLSKKE